MPSYTITDPDTGERKRFVGDAPPTEEQAAALFFAQTNSQPQVGIPAPRMAVYAAPPQEPLTHYIGRSPFAQDVGVGAGLVTRGARFIAGLPMEAGRRFAQSEVGQNITRGAQLVGSGVGALARAPYWAGRIVGESPVGGGIRTLADIPIAAGRLVGESPVGAGARTMFSAPEYLRRFRNYAVPPAQNQLVRVLNPDGIPGTLPAWAIDEARAQGYQILD